MYQVHTCQKFICTSHKDIGKKVAPPAGTNQTSCVASHCHYPHTGRHLIRFFSCFSCVFAVSARWLLKLNVMYSYTIKAGMSTVFFGGRGGTEEILGSWGGIAVKRLGTPALEGAAARVVAAAVAVAAVAVAAVALAAVAVAAVAVAAMAAVVVAVAVVR